MAKEKEKWLIQSFWTKPLIENKANMLDHKHMAELSLMFAKRSGFKVRMYTDDYGYELLKNIPYDEINTLLNEIPDSVSTNLFAISKFYALRDSGLGVIHIDYDVFIKKPICINDFYEDDSIDVICQCKEPMQDFYKKITNTLKILDLKTNYNVDCKDITNVGTIGFNNKELFDKYVNNYFGIIKQIDKNILDKHSFNKLDFSLEQVAISYFSKGYNIKYVLNEGDNPNDIGYTHLQGGGKYEKENIEKIKLLLFKFRVNKLFGLDTQ